MGPGYGTKPKDIGRRERRGDWLVLPEEADAAEEAFSRRHRLDRAADRAMRQPIEPNRRRWKRRAGAFDYPGVDTPTDDPSFSMMDSHHQRKVRKRREPTDAVPDPQEPQEWRGSKFLGAVQESSNELGPAVRSVWNELRF